MCDEVEMCKDVVRAPAAEAICQDGGGALDYCSGKRKRDEDGFLLMTTKEAEDMAQKEGERQDAARTARTAKFKNGWGAAEMATRSPCGGGGAGTSGAMSER